MERPASTCRTFAFYTLLQFIAVQVLALQFLITTMKPSSLRPRSFLYCAAFLLAPFFSEHLCAQTSPATMPVSIPAPNRAEYARLKAQVDYALQVDVLGQWFPRAQSEQGGFNQMFDEKWQRGDTAERSIVYQSRLTWVAAQAALRYPREAPIWKARALHGAKFLAQMWDAKNGGFFWAVQRGAKGQYQPQRDGEKHVYGIAFAIYALSAAHQATGDKASLQLAQRAFYWLEKHAHDNHYGGYYEALTRAGTPIVAPISDTQTSDVIGTRYGYKSMNSHIHLLEAFSALHHEWPDSFLKDSLNRTFHIVRDTIAVEPGALNLYFTPDWKPLPERDSFGHDIETAYLLIEAAHELKDNSAQTGKVARALVDHTLAFGWDEEHGGVYDAGGVFRTPHEEEETRKVWWTQAETLNALLLMHKRHGKSTSRYWNAFVQEWNWIQQYQTDKVNRGWFPEVARDGAPPVGRNKSDGWTEAYHQGRALLNVSEMLGELRGER